jgi:hypothetical protein
MTRLRQLMFLLPEGAYVTSTPTNSLFQPYYTATTDKQALPTCYSKRQANCLLLCNTTMDVHAGARLPAPMQCFTLVLYIVMVVQAGAGLAVSEMVIAATLQAGNAASRHLASWHADESIRSVQLYGVRPETLDWASK